MQWTTVEAIEEKNFKFRYLIYFPNKRTHRDSEVHRHRRDRERYTCHRHIETRMESIWERLMIGEGYRMREGLE